MGCRLSQLEQARREERHDLLRRHLNKQQEVPWARLKELGLPVPPNQSETFDVDVWNHKTNTELRSELFLVWCCQASKEEEEQPHQDLVLCHPNSDCDPTDESVRVINPSKYTIGCRHQQEETRAILCYKVDANMFVSSDTNAGHKRRRRRRHFVNIPCDCQTFATECNYVPFDKHWRPNQGFHADRVTVGTLAHRQYQFCRQYWPYATLSPANGATSEEEYRQSVLYWYDEDNPTKEQLEQHLDITYRALLKALDDDWDSSVPAATRRILNQVHVPAHIQETAQQEHAQRKAEFREWERQFYQGQWPHLQPTDSLRNMARATGKI